MRLLHFDEAAKLILTDFSGRDIPPYAILSHRWGREEVLFEDVRNNSYGKKAGYQKIEFCAKQASQDRLEYFWVDTCCIDKWNLRELSRSINSMYSWYRNAAKCYVFLPDVSVSDSPDANQQDVWREPFRKSDWFTRGWTLQELIAPESVEFFSLEGYRLGDKNSLGRELCDITGIPAKALRGHPLEGFFVEERISWVQPRRTTEPEDIAYCLLGILGVNMPASYGEGAEKAMQRLYNELESTKAVPSSIPFSRNLQFVGRESELAELEAKLFRAKQTRVIAITGARGTGKSQLALEFAYFIMEKHKGWTVFWIEASDTDGFHQAYVTIAQKLSIPGWDAEGADVKALVKLHLSNGIGRRWILVFDNADNIGLSQTNTSSSSVSNFAKYLPQSKLGSVILTTTNSDIAKILAKRHVMELPQMTPNTAQRMLEKHMKKSTAPSDGNEMKLLLGQLSYLPLAIVQAAAYINLNNICLKDYREQLRTRVLGQDKRLELRQYKTLNPVTLALFTSLDQIHRNHSLAARYLFLIACVDSKDIPLDLLGQDSTLRRENAIKIMADYALVTRRPAESALDVHRLVHLTIRELLQEKRWLKKWTEQAIKHLLEAFPENEYGNRSKWRRLLPHAKCVLSSDLIQQDHEERTELAWRYAIIISRDGRWEEARRLFTQVMETRKRVLGEEHPSTLTSMVKLASTYKDSGQDKEAEKLQIQVLDARKQVLGEDHPHTLTSIDHLASTYMHQKRWKEAEELQTVVMEARKRMLGEEHPHTLTSIDHLASTYRRQGRWNEAERMQKQVMDVRKRVLGEEHPSTLTSMAHLVSTYRNQRRWEEAEKLGVQAFEMRKRVLGEEHPSTLASMGSLALTLQDLGRLHSALEMIILCATLSNISLGAEHPVTISRHQWKRDWQDEFNQKERRILKDQKNQPSVKSLQ